VGCELLGGAPLVGARAPCTAVGLDILLSGPMEPFAATPMERFALERITAASLVSLSARRDRAAEVEADTVPAP